MVSRVSLSEKENQNIMMHSDTRSRIILEARMQFFTYGFSKVTINEIIGELGISKKTIYKYFPSKKALLYAAIESNFREIEDKLTELENDKSLDPIDKVINALQYLTSMLSTVKQPYMKDIMKSAPEAWDLISDYRKKRIFPVFEKFLLECYRRKAIRDEINGDLLIMIFLNFAQYILNPQILSEIPMSMQEIFESIYTILFEGILTDNARRKFKKKQLFKRDT
ncbi:MAG: TetR/AcrR family transcriptional regulator [Candidatus Coatesbacteria bacterium]|nr:TetR/AcrR family transcriptional regulator [Candidatus Coatesbacteria bacterium]